RRIVMLSAPKKNPARQANRTPVNASPLAARSARSRPPSRFSYPGDRPVLRRSGHSAAGGAPRSWAPAARGAADGPKSLPQLRREQLRLFPGGEVPSLVDLVEVDEGRVALLHPAAWRGEDLAGEGGERDRDRDRRRRLARRASLGLSALPVRARRR